MYVSLLGISGALDLDVFEQPVNRVFSPCWCLDEVLQRLPVLRAVGE
jgi:hypothetical protein